MKKFETVAEATEAVEKVAVAIEREECARIVDAEVERLKNLARHYDQQGNMTAKAWIIGIIVTTNHLADRIRARGKGVD